MGWSNETTFTINISLSEINVEGVLTRQEFSERGALSMNVFRSWLASGSGSGKPGHSGGSSEVENRCRDASRKRTGLVLMVLLVAPAVNAQTATLALSSAEIISGESAVLELSLSAVDLPPAAVEWVLQVPALNVSRLTIYDGPPLAAAGKTVICSGDATSLKCLLIGLNQETISDGVIAKVTVTLAAGADSATILVSDAAGVSRDGEPIAISSTSGTIAAIDLPSKHKSRPR
jgi:hypothetical protein